MSNKKHLKKSIKSISLLIKKQTKIYKKTKSEIANKEVIRLLEMKINLLKELK